MSQKTAFILSAAIATFLAVLAGGFMVSMTFGNAAAGTSGTATQPASMAANPASADVQALQQREQQYQQLLSEANRRLALAYAQTPVPPTVTPATSQPAYPISANQAAIIALNAAPGSNLASVPTLGTLRGAPAYQVTLDTGVVIVDANTGQVLFNSANAPQTNLGGGHDNGNNILGNPPSGGDD